MDIQTTRIALSVSEAAAAAGISRAFIYRALSSAELPSSLLGRRRIIRVADLDAWIVERRAGGRGGAA